MMALNVGKRKQDMALAMVFVVAGVLYALISLVNHYLFKTYTLDLGLYTHAMYDYVHFRVDDCTLFKAEPQNILSDHFDLYLVVLSPLVYVFGSYTLLLVQIAATLLGGWGIYKLIGLYSDDDWLPVLATAVFFFSFGIVHPFSFDYHSNVLTAMMLPWLLYFFRKGRYGKAALFVVLFVIGKENMSLWLFFVAIGLMWDYRKDRKALWNLLGYAVFAMAYFLVVNMIVMPRLGGSGGGFARYAYLGTDYLDVAKTLISHPDLTLKLLFSSTMDIEGLHGIREDMRYQLLTTIGNPNNVGMKEEFYFCLLATGLVLTLLKPNYLFMLLPLIGQKMLANQVGFWGISLHYSVEFMPVIVISSFMVIGKLGKRRARLALSLALLVSTVGATFYTIDRAKSYVNFGKIRVYQRRHYEQRMFDADYARELIRMIPDEASVCASAVFVPHLALRTEIYDFQQSQNDSRADYYLIMQQDLDAVWEGSPIFYRKVDYEMMATDGTLCLLRKRQPAP